ncbi:hypothetical protein Tco_1508480 [Tanacetum coccineum]
MKKTRIWCSDNSYALSIKEDMAYLRLNFTRNHKDLKNNTLDLNHLIGECPKLPKDKNQRAFVGGSWSDSGEEDDEKAKDETCLVAQASSEVCSKSSYFSDESSSIDEFTLEKYALELIWNPMRGCSKHMTGNQKLFSTYKAYNGGNVIFGSNLRGNIIGKELFLGEDAARAIPNMAFDLVDVEGVWRCHCGDDCEDDRIGLSGFGIGEVVLSIFDVLQRFGFFLQMGFTFILATFDGLDVGLLGDVIGGDDCDDDE